MTDIRIQAGGRRRNQPPAYFLETDDTIYFVDMDYTEFGVLETVIHEELHAALYHVVGNGHQDVDQFGISVWLVADDPRDGLREVEAPTDVRRLVDRRRGQRPVSGPDFVQSRV